MARPKKPAPGSTAAVAAAAAAAAVKASQQNGSNVVDFVLPDEEDEEQGLVDDLLEDLEKIDESHGGGITWELYCDVPLDRSGQICRLGRSELRDLRNRCLEFGPGEYHVVARATNGKFVTGTRRNIKISGLARGPNAPAQSAQPQLDPMQFMQLMEERAEKRRLQASRERMEQIKFWAPILAPIGVEMAKGLFGGRGGESIKDLVQALVSMKALQGGDSQVDTLLKGIELAQTLAPDGPSKGSTWSDVVTNGLRELRPVVESLTQRKVQQAAAPAAPVPQLKFVVTPPTDAAGAAPSGAPAAPAGSSPPAEAEMFAMFEPLLRKLATELEEYASNATDPGLTAEALLAKIPRLVKSQISTEQLLAWLNEPNWWAIVSGFHPGLTPYQAYCDQVREELIAEVTNPGGTEEGPAEGES